MNTISISKNEYKQLKRHAQAYQRFAANFFEYAIQDPIDQTVEDFRKTDLYSKNFLEDLESGLRKSSYSKQYADKAIFCCI